MNKYLAISIIWMSVALVSFNDIGATIALGVFAMVATFMVTI